MYKYPTKTRITARHATAKPLFRTNLATIETYPLLVRSNQLLNASKNLSSNPFLAIGSCGFKIIAQRAGVNVNATNADSAIEIAIVRANCLYRTPIIPPKNATGTKTAANTNAIATTGP